MRCTGLPKEGSSSAPAAPQEDGHVNPKGKAANDKHPQSDPNWGLLGPQSAPKAAPDSVGSPVMRQQSITPRSAQGRDEGPYAEHTVARVGIKSLIPLCLLRA